MVCFPGSTCSSDLWFTGSSCRALLTPSGILWFGMDRAQKAWATFPRYQVHMAVNPFSKPAVPSCGSTLGSICCMVFHFREGYKTRSSAAPVLGRRGSRRCLPSFRFLFGVLEGSACSSLLWHALPFGTCLIHAVSFCRSHAVCVKERTGQKREKEETLETDKGHLHIESGSWKRT